MNSQSPPKPYSKDDVMRCIAQWNEESTRQEYSPIASWMTGVTSHALMAAVFGNSPYLARLLLQHPELFHDIVELGVDEAYTRLCATHIAYQPDGSDMAAMMKTLRVFKNQIALLVALADISGEWGWEKVTLALSDFAEYCLKIVIDSLLSIAHKRGEIILKHSDAPSKESGIIVLGMGKLGGYELNYSSDIDLIILFDPEKLNYTGRHNTQHFVNKLAYDLVNIMQERTAQGYVFRTDLRLRPDPASTPPVVNINAAYHYYESVGQNWERAAMIKARPVAGDIPAAEEFLKNMTPFMWRRSLDFASINDIYSIKRQMDSLHQEEICFKGHNVKLGKGGIREIEFYVQIHQLIWGGRQPQLRSRATCETLSHITEFGLVGEDKEEQLKDAYAFLRKVEHRLQMIADEQTHTLPDTDDGIAHVSCFMGYKQVADFEHDLMGHLRRVHSIYASSFQGPEALGEEGNLVFTGTIHDPDTLETLRKMGYRQPETVSEIVMGWHHGSRRATRPKRARELLTELMPTLLKRLSETANPDGAFLKFNDFLNNLPAAVQLFSLFNANPHLLGLIADIMGSAPTLADTLSKNPSLLEAVLYEDFYGPLPSMELLKTQLTDALSPHDTFEGQMDELRRFRNEKQFQAGVQMLKHMISSREAGEFLSDLADVLINSTVTIVVGEFFEKYGQLPGSTFAVIALGKLGSREMTVSSDIDLVFIYDSENTQHSDGEKSLSASLYFNRLSQRLLNALSAMGRDGRLYEVDTRLRPSGNQGLLAVSTQALQQYFEESAWTFEYMAFTKARVVYGDETIHATLDSFINNQLVKSRDKQMLLADVLDMRARIEKEHSSNNPWNIKYVRGGLIDIDFIAQYLLLLHAPNTAGVRPGSASDIFIWLKHKKKLPASTIDTLLEADRFLGQVFHMLRLCCNSDFDEVFSPQGLKKLLAESTHMDDFSALREKLIAVEQSVYAQYNALLGNP